MNCLDMLWMSSGNGKTMSWHTRLKTGMIAATLVLSGPVFATPVVDGHLGDNEYSNSFTASWYNGHNQAGSQYQKGGSQETTVWWQSTQDRFFLYLEAPLEAKNMVWGNGFTEDELRLYYQHWCSPNDGNPAADDGSNCSHHKKGFDTFKNKADYKGMTGSEKVIFGSGKFKQDKKGFTAFDAKHLTGVLADLAKASDPVTIGNSYLGLSLVNYRDSVAYVKTNYSCNTNGCAAYDIPMAFEFEFGALSNDNRDQLISDIQTFGLEFHLSPERGAAPTQVPEPGGVALLGMGLAALGWARRKRIS